MKKEKWIWEWERRMYPFIWWHIAKGWAHGYFNTSPLPTVFVFQKTKANMYLHQSILSKNAKKLLKIISTDPEYLKRYKKEMANEARKIKRFGNYLLNHPLQKASPSELCQLLNHYSEVYRMYGVVPIRTFNRVGIQALQDFLYKKGVPNEKIPSYLAILTHPRRLSKFEIAKRELIRISRIISRISKLRRLFISDSVSKIKKKIEASPEFKELINKWIKKYGYLSCGYADEEPLGEEAVIENIKDLLKQAKETQKRPVAFSKNSIINQLKPPSSIGRVIKALSEFTFYKDFIRSNYNFLHWSSKGLFKEIAKRLNVSLEELRMLMPYEITRALKLNKIENSLLKLIKERRSLCVIYTTKREPKIFTGEKAEEFLKRELTSNEPSIGGTSLTGLVANPGKVTAPIKIIKTPKDIYKAGGNFILVATMTTPEIVPAAQRAKGIVTDEGGITCHAAIISRELGIPCVVGTKIATKVLKDGDIIELDAEKGIVRKI